MTIALAALCGFPRDIYIIAAADRMVTFGDVEFEQPQPKMWPLHANCFAVFFGLSDAQAQIASKTADHVAEQSITDIAATAELYAWFMRDYVRREAEADILAPLALKSADLLLMPTLPLKATPLPPANASREEYVARALEMISNTCPFDVTGHPAVTLPVGMSAGQRVLIVSNTERDDVIRIISARKAEPKEIRIYEEGE